MSLRSAEIDEYLIVLATKYSTDVPSLTNKLNSIKESQKLGDSGALAVLKSDLSFRARELAEEKMPRVEVIVKYEIGSDVGDLMAQEIERAVKDAVGRVKIVVEPQIVRVSAKRVN